MASVSLTGLLRGARNLAGKLFYWMAQTKGVIRLEPMSASELQAMVLKGRDGREAAGRFWPSADSPLLGRLFEKQTLQV